MSLVARRGAPQVHWSVHHGNMHLSYWTQGYTIEYFPCWLWAFLWLPPTHPAMPPFLSFRMGCLLCVVVYWKCKFLYFLGANSEKTAFGQDGTVKACGTLG